MLSTNGSTMRELPLSSRTGRGAAGPQTHPFGLGPARRARAGSSWFTVQRTRADDAAGTPSDSSTGALSESEEKGWPPRDLASRKPVLAGPVRRTRLSRARQVAEAALAEAASSEAEAKPAEVKSSPTESAASRFEAAFRETNEEKEKDFSTMDNSVKAIAHPAASRSLREAIGKARLKEAERLDRTADHRDGEIARLELLKAELDSVFADIPNHDDRFNLALVPSRPARLWVDLFTYVTVDEGTNAYLFMRNSENGRRTLFRATNVVEAADRITDYVAGEIVRRERMDVALVQPGIRPQGAYVEANPRLNTRMVVLGFIVGLLTGAVGLFAAVWLSAT